MDLKTKVIKLAYEQPELRNHLLPLVVSASKTFKCPECGSKVLEETKYCVKCKKKVKKASSNGRRKNAGHIFDVTTEILGHFHRVTVFGDLEREELRRRLEDEEKFEVLEDNMDWGWEIEFKDGAKVTIEV